MNELKKRFKKKDFSIINYLKKIKFKKKIT
jgi:hypothetical protein